MCILRRLSSKVVIVGCLLLSACNMIVRVLAWMQCGLYCMTHLAAWACYGTCNRQGPQQTVLFVGLVKQDVSPPLSSSCFALTLCLAFFACLQSTRRLSSGADATLHELIRRPCTQLASVRSNITEMQHMYCQFSGCSLATPFTRTFGEPLPPKRPPKMPAATTSREEVFR